MDSRDSLERNPRKAFKEFPTGLRMWTDFRQMLDKQKDIDAIFVSTPDHSHAVISMRAMEMGKHVVCEKLMTRTISELRALASVARKYKKVTTQCDMEGHAFDELRSMVEWVKAGVIGEVREVHIWEGSNDRPRGYPDIKAPLPVPSYLNWDLWLGPARVRVALDAEGRLAELANRETAHSYLVPAGRHAPWRMYYRRKTPIDGAGVGDSDRWPERPGQTEWQQPGAGLCKTHADSRFRITGSCRMTVALMAFRRI